MEKIGIITICDYLNYGNRLQNYASQEVIKALGYQVDTIVNISSKTNFQNQLSKLLTMPKKDLLKRVIWKLKYIINKKHVDEMHNQRINVFKNFTQKYINETRFTISENKLPLNLLDNYEYFIVGSDQVWNPIFRHGSYIDFLTFAPKLKRISYAASFGIESIPDEYVNKYRLWLSEMKDISVREEAGARIIKELTGKDAVVLIDPTLMLSKEKWLSISKQAVNKPKNPYLLTYFLGEISKVTESEIKNVSLENSLEIVRLAELNNKIHYSADPGEFIDYINSAEVILTDSFHGAVFSIILEKPFIIFDRVDKNGSMNSRLDTLLLLFKLESRKWRNITKNSDIYNVNYSHVAQILEFEQKKAFEYLKNALSEKGKT